MACPAVDDDLAEEVFGAIGADRDDPVEAVVDRFRGWLPAGSTAKWRAIDRGQVPPGADPTTGIEARLAGSLESWSCWVLCTGLGAVLAAAGHDVRIAVEHHRSRSDVVDFHSILVVDGAMVDPYLGPSAPVPPGHDVTRADAWAAWVPGPTPDHPRPDHLGLRGGGSTYRYRLLADHLEARDIAAFCEVSATHSGVGRRRYAHWLAGDRLWMVRELDRDIEHGPGEEAPGEEASAELRVTEGASPFSQTRRLVARGPYDELRHHLAAPVEVPIDAPAGEPA